MKMRAKIESVACVAILVFSIIALIPIATASPDVIYVPGDHKKIQWAIDNATAGDTIIVNSGIYHEGVTVNKQLTLKGIGMPVVDADGRGKAIGIYADGVTLEGFKATNSSGSGIYVDSHNNNITGNIASDNGGFGVCLGYPYPSNNNAITGNTVSNNGGGIWLIGSNNNTVTGNTVSNDTSPDCPGILLTCSSNNTVTGNTVSNNSDGIWLTYSNNSVIAGNTVSNNNGYGIHLWYSSNNNAITDNTVSNNGDYGIYLESSSNNNIITGNTVSNNEFSGIGLFDSSNNNIITGNTVSNNEFSGIDLDDSSNNEITGNTVSNNSEDGIFLFNSSNNEITDNTVSNNSYSGISLCDSSGNEITDNTASNNSDGIYLLNSSNNEITDNTVSNNDWDGIVLFDSSNNIIYNNYFNNTVNAYDDGNNTWNIAKTHGTNIVGGPYLGGNYWSDYNGVDLDGDKLGDTLLPYNCSGGIQNGGDYHPLIEIKVKGHKFNDIDGDGVWDRVNESGLANWTIRLEGTAEDGSTVSLNTTTDGNGYYKFEDVPKGTYNLSELLKEGWIQTLPPAPGTYMIYIANGGVEDKDFGNRRFWVSGYKFNDINGDGVWDWVNESVLSNWTIKLEGTAEDGSTVSLTNITDGNGYYRFENVPKGTYTLSEILKVGWIRTCPPPPGTYTIDVTDDDVKGKNFGNRRFIHYDENIIVGAPYEDVEGNKDQGRVYRFYGLTGKLRHTLNTSNPQPDALFGYSVSAGMVGSDYREEIIVGAPGEDRVYTFYGATSKLHHTIDCPSPQPDTLFGYSVSTGDVNGDGFDEIIVGAPYEDVGDNESQGRVYTFYALTGKLHHTIDCPNPRPGALFGHSVSAGDLNGDGFDEIIVGTPREDVGDNESQGRVYTFYGLTSKLRHILDCPNPRPDALFGYSVNAVDLVSDYREEVIVGAPGEDVGGNESQGRVYTFYGATGKLHLPLNCTSPRSYVDFGHSVGVGDMSGDGLNEVIVGAPGEGRVYTFYGLTGKLRHTIGCPIPQPDALFGWSVSAGTVGSDYRDEVIVGAPGEDVGGNESQGRVYTFYGATSKLRHILDTPNPQSDANFGWSVGVIGGFMGVTCSDPNVDIDHTQTSVTDDPVLARGMMFQTHLPM